MSTTNRTDGIAVRTIAAFAIAGAVACSSGNSSPATTTTDAGSTTTTTDSGSSNTTTDASNASDTGANTPDTGTSTADASSTSDASADDGGTSDAASEAASGPTLTVMNFLGWCSVTVNGGTPSTGAVITTPVTAGSMATITATTANAAMFEVGADPWFGVDENDGGAAAGTDTGTGAAKTSTVTVTVNGDRCVSVCCQDLGTPASCPATNPCP